MLLHHSLMPLILHNVGSAVDTSEYSNYLVSLFRNLTCIVVFDKFTTIYQFLFQTDRPVLFAGTIRLDFRPAARQPTSGEPVCLFYHSRLHRERRPAWNPRILRHFVEAFNQKLHTGSNSQNPDAAAEWCGNYWPNAVSLYFVTYHSVTIICKLDFHIYIWTKGSSQVIIILLLLQH